MDYVSYFAPATVRTLVVPVNELVQSDLRRYLDILKRVRDVRTLDLTPNPGKFNPQAYPHGHIYYSFVTKDEDSETLFLHDFEPYRKTNIVIGIAKWNIDMNDDTIRDLKSELKKRYPSPISIFMMIFDSPKEFETKVAEVYAIDESTLNMETKLCDLTSRFLTNFSTYASAYEHTTLRSPGNMNLGIKKNRKRYSSSFELNSDKLQHLQSKGRKMKLSANFYMIAGNLKTALTEFSEAIYNLKISHDFLWLASALDGLGVCLFLLTSIGVPYQLPPFLESVLLSADDFKISSPLASPRSSFQSSRISGSFTRNSSTPVENSLDVISLEKVKTSILGCGKLAAAFYKEARSQEDDEVPQIVFSECLIRYCSLEVAINVNRKFDLDLIETILGNLVYDNRKTGDDFESDSFNQLCHFVLNTKFQDLSKGQQMKIFYTLAGLFWKANMKMKYTLMISRYIDLIIASDNIVYGSSSEYNYLNKMLDDYCFINNLVSDNESPNYFQKNQMTQLLKFCAKVNDFTAYVSYGFLALKNFQALLNHDEQIDIHNNLKKFASFVDNIPEYWDSHIFVDLQYEIEANSIVEGETCAVSVVLRNPFAFAIEVSNLNLATSNNFPLKVSISDFDEADDANNIVSNVLKPYSETVIFFNIVPQEPGILEITGIIAAVDLCMPQKFTIYTTKLASFLPKIHEPRMETAKVIKTWPINVVHSQPLLKIINISLTDKWLMLLDGERQKFRVDLKNISKTEINHLISSFRDSTTELLTAELQNKSLQPTEVYEIEYQLLKRKAFKILNKDQLSNIKGNEQFYLDVEIMGKLGVKEASLVLTYSHQKELSSEFQRSLTIPLNLTVYPSVELAGCDIIPLTSNTRFSEDNCDPCWKYLRDLKRQGQNLSQFCLVALDFVNMWSEQMEICVDCNEPNELDKRTLPPFSFICNIHSRKNIRVFVPLLRMDLDDDYLNQRIPSLRNKQFVLDTKTPAAEQLFHKRSFWYKEEILKRIKASWKVSVTVEDSIHAGKSGEIDIRGFRFSSKMIEILEIEKIGISLQLLDEKEKYVELNKVKLNEFYTIRVTIQNRFKTPVFGMIRHIPVCKDPPYAYEKKILINGALQFSVEKRIQPDTTKFFDLGITFIEKGEYEWGAVFDEMSGWDTGNIAIIKHHLQREQLKFTIQ